MAFSGIAATLLHSGRTLHNRFALPVPLFSSSNSSINRNSKEWQEIMKTDVFIIDEGSMVPKHVLNIIHNLLRQVENDEILFGGKIFLFGGDFRQILPIQEHATRAELVNLSLKGSEFWPCFKIFKLTKNMRANASTKQINNINFEDWILKLGNEN